MTTRKTTAKHPTEASYYATLANGTYLWFASMRNTKVLNKQKAWAAGKNVMITIPNPIKSETNKPFVRVPATQLWGKPGAKYRMKDSGITEVK